MSDEIRKDPEIDHEEESMKLSGEQLDEVSGGAARRPAVRYPSRIQSLDRLPRPINERSTVKRYPRRTISS